MKTIHKFAVPYVDVCDVEMPRGARVVHVGEQREVIWLWAIVDTEAPMTVHRFRVTGTGHDLEGVGEYLGTAHLKGLGLVFHVFEMGEITE